MSPTCFRSMTISNQVPGIDIMDWRTEKIKELIDFQLLDFSLEGTTSARKYDTLSCLAVLHHTGRSEEDMIRYLSNLRSVMNKNGRLIIEEDVIFPAEEQEIYSDLASQAQELAKHQGYLNRFLSMDQNTQRDTIICIDFLANCLSVGVPEMPFPCGFQTMGTWMSIFDKVGYKLIEVRILGFVSK